MGKLWAEYKQHIFLTEVKLAKLKKGVTGIPGGDSCFPGIQKAAKPLFPFLKEHRK